MTRGDAGRVSPLRAREKSFTSTRCASTPASTPIERIPDSRSYFMKTRQTRLAPTAIGEESASSISLSAPERGGLDAPLVTSDFLDLCSTIDTKLLHGFCRAEPDNPSPPLSCRTLSTAAAQTRQTDTARAGGRGREDPAPAPPTPPRQRARGTRGAWRGGKRCGALSGERGREGREGRRARRGCKRANPPQGRGRATGRTRRPTATPRPRPPRPQKWGMCAGADGRGARGGAGTTGDGGGRSDCAAPHPPRARGRGEGGGKPRGRGEGWGLRLIDTGSKSGK